MSNLINFVKSFSNKEDGQDLLEYALLVALIALIAIGAVHGWRFGERDLHGDRRLARRRGVRVEVTPVQRAAVSSCARRRVAPTLSSRELRARGARHDAPKPVAGAVARAARHSGTQHLHVAPLVTDCTCSIGLEQTSMQSPVAVAAFKSFTEARRFRRSEEGQDLLEYGLLAALIAIIALGAVTSVGNVINTVFWNVIAGSV